MEYNKKTRRELVAICKERGIRHYSGKNKEMICLLIEQASQNKTVESTSPINNTHIGDVISEIPTIAAKTVQEYIIDESIVIKSKKYKTIGDLKNAGIKSIIQTTTRMDKCMGRDHLDKWLWETYYSKKKYAGNLTMRIANINNSICYREIMKRCFNGVDILSNYINKEILSKTVIELIAELHSISPSMLGTFIDYLIRRIISELLGKMFKDSRSECGSRASHSCNKPIINYDEKSIIELREMCKDRYVMEGDKMKQLSKLNKGAMIKHLTEIQDLEKCKLTIECMNKCVLPVCQYLCYEKTKNTIEYKTKDIIAEIFITSLFHSQAFGQAPQQEHFNNFYEKLTKDNIISDILIPSLTELCIELIKNKSSILLNPVLGGGLDGVNSSIPSDADLVIDDILFDIKCTKNNHPILEITQLLGYSSLMMLNKKYRTKINKISIINILSGIITTYNIDFINQEQCISYIKILTNISEL